MRVNRSSTTWKYRERQIRLELRDEGIAPARLGARQNYSASLSRLQGIAYISLQFLPYDAPTQIALEHPATFPPSRPASALA